MYSYTYITLIALRWYEQYTKTNIHSTHQRVFNIFNADFDYSNNINTVNFTNLSSNFESVLWDFGDGNTSFEENPQHTYTSSGTYTVDLYTFTNGGCLVDTITIDIVVNLSTSVESPNQEGRLLKIVDVLGRNSNIKKNSILYYLKVYNH